MSKIRFSDIVISFIALLVLSPVFILVSLLIKLNSRGPVFYLQQRVGKGNLDFGLYKFRTMYVDADKMGLLTIGGKDNRITKAGYFLRKFKLDELPQLLNVLKGEMSLVGPRPEVRKYVKLYTAEQLKVLDVLPGITDYASIEYRNENELLSTAENPETFYIEMVMPEKIRLNFKFIEHPDFGQYIKILWLTFTGFFNKRT